MYSPTDHVNCILQAEKCGGVWEKQQGQTQKRESRKCGARRYALVYGGHTIVSYVKVPVYVMS